MSSISPDFAIFRDPSNESDVYMNLEEEAITMFLEESESMFKQIMSKAYGYKIEEREGKGMEAEDVKPVEQETQEESQDTQDSFDSDYQEDFFDD